MKNRNDKTKLNKREEIQMDNEFLKLKLQAEFGASIGKSAPGLSPEMENKWLNSVFDFETKYRNAKKITVYELIGKPAFKMAGDLKTNTQVSKELRRVEKILNKHHITLSCICEYEDVVIYRFITEELFHVETDDMQLPGWTTNYIYEEFHPNHEYDLKQKAENFLEVLFVNEWHPKWEKMNYKKEVELNGKKLTFKGFSAAMEVIKSLETLPGPESWNFTNIRFDLEENTGEVSGYIEFPEDTRNEFFKDPSPFHFSFEKESEVWVFVKLKLPFLDKV